MTMKLLASLESAAALQRRKAALARKKAAKKTARKKTARKKVAKKAPARKKTVRKKVAKKAPARKKIVRKKVAKKAARKATGPKGYRYMVQVSTKAWRFASYSTYKSWRGKKRRIRT